jgi:hypothetical protein
MRKHSKSKKCKKMHRCNKTYKRKRGGNNKFLYAMRSDVSRIIHNFMGKCHFNLDKLEKKLNKIFLPAMKLVKDYNDIDYDTIDSIISYLHYLNELNSEEIKNCMITQSKSSNSNSKSQIQFNMKGHIFSLLRICSIIWTDPFVQDAIKSNLNKLNILAELLSKLTDITKDKYNMQNMYIDIKEYIDNYINIRNAEIQRKLSENNNNNNNNNNNA